MARRPLPAAPVSMSERYLAGLLLAALLAPTLVVSCGDADPPPAELVRTEPQLESNRLDASTQTAFQESAARLRRSLPEDEREDFDRAIVALAFSAVDMRKLAKGDLDSDSIESDMRARLNGLTAGEVLTEWRSRNAAAEQLAAERATERATEREAERAVEREARAAAERLELEESQARAAAERIELEKARERTAALMAKIELSRVSVEPTRSSRDALAAHIGLQARNTADVPLEELVVTVYFLNEAGQRIHENRRDLLAGDWGVRETMRPGYVVQRSGSERLYMTDIPDEWDRRTIEVAITGIGEADATEDPVSGPAVVVQRDLTPPEESDPESERTRAEPEPNRDDPDSNSNDDRKAEPADETTTTTEPDPTAAYLDKIVTSNLESRRFDSVLEKDQAGVRFELRNTGDRTVERIEVTVQFLNDEGSPISERSFTPVHPSALVSDGSPPLRPGYIWSLPSGEYWTPDNIPTVWVPGKVRVNVSSLDFAAADSDDGPGPEERAYLNQIEVYDIAAKRYRTYLDDSVPGVRFSLRNTGERSIDQVCVRATFLTSDGTPVTESTYTPVLVSEWSSRNNEPLKPGFVREMDKGTFLRAEHVPSAWDGHSVHIEVIDLAFSKD